MLSGSDSKNRRNGPKKPTESEAPDCSVRPRSASHAQAVLGFRRLSSRSPQNPSRRLDVGLSTAIPNRPGGAGRVPDDAGRLARLTARRDPASRRQWATRDFGSSFRRWRAAKTSTAC